MRAPAPASSNAGISVSGASIVRTAMQYIGYPYSATGNSPSTGFSCIGFVSFVYRQNGINLPGDLGGAMAYAPQVSLSNLMPGDILYFQNTLWTGLSHTGIYIGGGKFIHAEYYGYGVRVTSFNNDSRDGNYWIAHYLGANRPWGGAAVSPLVGVGNLGGSAPAVGTGPTTQVVKGVATGPTGVVNTGPLNVRSQPSRSSSVQQVVPQGTSVVILGRSHGWYKVQLPDGSVGWVMGRYVSKGSAGSPVPGVSDSSSVAGVVGNPTAPARQGYPSAHRTPATVSVKVGTLYVHSSPSRSSYVVTTVGRGQQLVVVARQNGWEKVQLPDGTVGWIRSNANASRPAAPAASSSLSGGSSASVAMNVRTGPSMNNSVATVLPAGGKYQILGWSNGWAHVRLADGTTGWIRGDVVGGAPASSSGAGPTYGQYSYGHSKRSTHASTQTRSRATSSRGGSVVTAGVRVHSSPGVNAPVTGGASAGTHVQVLGRSGSWVLVRLPNGQTGYVLGTYVR